MTRLGEPRPSGGPSASSEGDDSDPGPSFVVQYADDDEHVFWDGTRMRFGRDADVCQIPIWEKIRDRALSRVAGEIWCASGQMWVRNLSTAHEIVIGGSAGTSHVLPAKSGDDPGNACSVPAPRGTVSAPSTGAWSLTVCRVGAAGRDDVTLRVENIPERLRDAAEALCAPLLAGGAAPASYAQIAQDRGWTDRVARRRVEELCLHYKAQVEALPGGRGPGETLTNAVARALYDRNKFAVPRQPPVRSTGRGAS